MACASFFPGILNNYVHFYFCVFQWSLGSWMGGANDLPVGSCLGGTSGKTQACVLFCFKPLHFFKKVYVCFAQDLGLLRGGDSPESFCSERSGPQSCEFNRLHTNVCHATDPMHCPSM